MTETTLRALLAEVYTQEGVDIVMRSRIGTLDNQTPLEMLATDEARVIGWAASLIRDGSYVTAMEAGAGCLSGRDSNPHPATVSPPPLRLLFPG